MIVDTLLSTKFQLGTLRELDSLPYSELTQYLKQYLISCRVDNKSEKTIIVYARFISYFVKFLVESGITCTPEKIDRNHIRYFILSLQERNLTPETVSSYYRALHTFFNWLENEQYIVDNPFLKLHAPKVPKKHVRAFSQEILDKIITLCSADKTFTGMRNYAIVLVLLDTGIRQQELTNIKLSDIYFDRGLSV